MRIGVNLHNYGLFASKPAIDKIAERAEALGYDSIWTADHVLVPRTEPEPFGQLLETLTTLSYIAAKTRRIALGTSILVLPQREPILVAKQAATLDHLSGGRLTLGIGVGWIEREFEYLGADFAARGDRADEYIAALRELWTAEEPRFDGDAVRFDDAIFSPRPRRQNGIPILVGGASTRALRRAARLADGWHALDASPKKIHDAAVTLATFSPDRRVEISLRIKTAVGRVARPSGASEDPHHGVLEGEPDAIAVTILRYRDAGVTHIVIDPDTSDLEQYLEDLETFAAEVRPLGNFIASDEAEPNDLTPPTATDADLHQRSQP
jgi:probable F420-dependent oxidoreductase